MSRSRGNRKQLGQVRRRTKPTTGQVEVPPKLARQGRDRYAPGAVDFSLDQVGPMLYGASPEQLPVMGLPFWYLLIADEEPANRCLDAALTLQAAYAMYGIEAVPAPAELAVPAQGGGTTVYGNPHPRIEDDLLIGHAGLWLLSNEPGPATRRSGT